MIGKYNLGIGSISLLILVLVIAAAVYQYWQKWGSYELDESSFSANELKIVEQDTGVHFPDGAQGLNLFNARFQIDPSMLVRVKIPDRKTNEMFEKIQFLPNEKIHVVDYLGRRVTWWHPEQGQSLIERRYFNATNGDFLDLELRKQAGTNLLYVEWGVR